jgi:hypothetical protein
MWAVIGVYSGEEFNRFYERTLDGIRESGSRAVEARQALALQADAIHSVENPHRAWTAGLHVYGGDIIGVERSAWGPDDREVPFGDSAPGLRSLYTAMYDLAGEYEKRLDDDARYDALLALRNACEHQRSYPTRDEARRIVADAWGISI